jgi:uncharacterized cupin superfamily protein
MIRHWDDAPWETIEHGDLRCERQRLCFTTGAPRAALSRYRIEPGRRPMPQHVHADEEEIFLEDEIFVVLAGGGTVLLGDDAAAVRRGSVVYRPRGTGVAHTFEAAGDGLTLLAYGTREPDDICWYPDSRKLFFGGVGVIARVEPLDYWDGEQ